MPPTDPYGAFGFLVEIDGVDVAGFTEVSGLEFEIEPIEYRTGDEPTVVRKIPGLRKFGNIVLKRGMTSDLEFWDWILESMEGMVTKRDGVISILDEQRERVAGWRFRNGWPCKYRGPHLVAAGSEVAIETLEICHEGLRRD